MYPVLYIAKYWDEDTKKIETEHGITFANSFTEASKYIENYYGNELNSIHIQLLEENNILKITENEYQRILKDE